MVLFLDIFFIIDKRRSYCIIIFISYSVTKLIDENPIGNQKSSHKTRWKSHTETGKPITRLTAGLPARVSPVFGLTHSVCGFDATLTNNVSAVKGPLIASEHVEVGTRRFANKCRKCN